MNGLECDMGSPEVTSAPPVELPAVDDQLLAEGCRYEIYDGVLVYYPPADELCGTRRVKVSALITVHVASDFKGALNLLTRTSETSDVAPNISVLPIARDPETGGRQIERLAFDVGRTASLEHSARKAAKLTARGVHRVFAIDVERDCVLEWSGALGDWTHLAIDAEISDRSLAVPLRVDTLVPCDSVQDAMARALIARRNRVIEAAKAEARALGRAQGLIDGKIDRLLTLLEAGGVAMADADRERIRGERDVTRLDRWIASAFRCTHIAELLAVQ